MGNMLFGLPTLWAIVFIVAAAFVVIAIIKAAKVLCVFTGSDLLYEGKWSPTQEQIQQKRYVERLFRLSRFFAYSVIYIYLIKVKMLFSLVLTEQLRLLCIWLFSAIAIIYAFAFIITHIITTKYINKILK